jgi:hypothetical protein
MKHRWPLAAAGLLAVCGGVYWLVRSPEPQAAPSKAARSGKVEGELRAGKPEKRIDLKPPVKMVMTESGLKPMVQRKPRVWVDPVSGAINREIVDAVPDPESEAREELKYRKSRLRLALSDEAAACWSGGDVKDEEIELEYTLIVENEVIRTDNVRVKQSSLKSANVERCIIDSVRDLRAFAERIPNLREEQGLTISMHDLFVRNRAAAPEDKSEDPKESFDKEPAKIPGAK